MDILGGIAAASQALGIAKALRGIEKDYDAATYKVQIVDLIDALSNAKLALVDARENTAELEAEIARLRASFDAKAKLVKGAGDYSYFTDDDGKPIGFPACPGCEAGGRIVQLKQDGPTETARCPTCDKSHSPVTCYLPGGGTLREDELRRQSEAFERANARFQQRSFGRDGWMAR